jgi:hypothetical protein
VPPEDGRLTPETCRGLRHNKVCESENVLSWLRYCDVFISSMKEIALCFAPQAIFRLILVIPVIIL